MRPNTSPLNVQYPCRCGATHNAVFRLFSLNILVCPEVQDDALHFVYEAPPKVSYLLTGERRAENPVVDLAALKVDPYAPSGEISEWPDPMEHGIPPRRKRERK